MNELQKKNAEIKPAFNAKERAEIIERYNLSHVLRRLGGDMTDTGYEAEIGEEAMRRDTEGRQTTTTHGGYYIPDFVLARTMFGKTPVADHIAGNGAALVATDLLMSELVSPLEARLVLTKLGVRFVDGLVGDIAIPKASGVSA